MLYLLPNYKVMNFSKLLLFLVFCLLCVNVFSQQTKIDSLKSKLKNEKVDTSKISLNLDLSKVYRTINLDSFYHYSKKAEKLAKLNNNYLLNRTYVSTGLYHVYKNQGDSAKYYFDETLKLLDKKEDTLIRAYVYSNYALLYTNSYDVEKKIEYNLKAIKLLEKNHLEVCRLYFNQAINYAQAEQDSVAKKYLHKSLKNSVLSNNKLVEAYARKGLAHYAIQENELDSASVLLERSRLLSEELNSNELSFEIYSKLGELYDKLEMFDKAESYLLKAKEIAFDFGRVYNQLSINIFLGQHETKRKNYLKAIAYYKDFDALYKSNPIPELGALAYREWSEIEKNIGHNKVSRDLLERYVIINDSLFNKQNKNAVADAEAKFETEKKDKEILQQQLEIEKNENQLKKRNLQYGYMTGLVILLVASLLLLWFLNQQRQQRKDQELLALQRKNQIQTLESLRQGEEQERYRIAKELHDGVNGDLSAIKHKLSQLQKTTNIELSEAINMIDDSCDQVRAISHNLVPPVLDKFDLKTAASDYCAQMDDIHKPKIRFQYLGNVLSLSKKNEINIFRIIQELVTNSIKHAKAKEINVQLSAINGHVQLTVEDDGIGYDITQLSNEGIGLTNVKHRVAYLKGDLDITSGNDGTYVNILMDKKDLNEN